MSGAVPAPEDHGGDARRVAASLGLDPASVIDLSISLNPVAPDVAAVVAGVLRADPAAITDYPHAAAAEARLARAIGVDPARLVLTNGGAEAIALVAQRHPVGHVVDPEFSLYRRHLAHLDATGLRWRSNPRTPFGTLADPGEHADVWDEAFYPLATGRWTRGDDAAWRLGSLTKLWACPGLRLGYVIAPDPVAAEDLRRRRPRWSVGGLALAALAELLTRTDLVGWRRRIVELRAELVAGLRGLGLCVEDTAANWVLVERPGLRGELAPHGVVVRDCASFGLPGWGRAAVPRPEDLSRVLAAFAAVAGDG